jgi:DivIVA domain-containing protein
MTPVFKTVLRGYDRFAVDPVVAAAEEALQRRDPASVARVAQLITEFRRNPVVVLRGYDREQVDQYLAKITAELARA